MSPSRSSSTIVWCTVGGWYLAAAITAGERGTALLPWDFAAAISAAAATP